MPHALFHLRCRVQVAAALHAKGLTAVDAAHRVGVLLDGPTIDAAVAQVAGAPAAVAKLATFAPGQFLLELVAFFQSDIGKAVVALLVALLMADGA